MKKKYHISCALNLLNASARICHEAKKSWLKGWHLICAFEHDKRQWVRSSWMAFKGAFSLFGQRGTARLTRWYAVWKAGFKGWGRTLFKYHLAIWQVRRWGILKVVMTTRTTEKTFPVLDGNPEGNPYISCRVTLRLTCAFLVWFPPYPPKWWSLC